MSDLTFLNLIVAALVLCIVLGIWLGNRDSRRREEYHQRRVRQMIRLSAEEMAAFRKLVCKEEECYSLGVFQDDPDFLHYDILVMYELAEQDRSPGLRDDCVFFHLTDYGRKFRDERGL